MANHDKDEFLELVSEAGGERLDRFLADAVPDLSRTEIQRLIKGEAVLVNGIPAKPSYRLAIEDVIRISLPPSQSSEIEAENIPLEVLYTDADLVAINKAAGMVVHPAGSSEGGTLLNAALWHWPEMRQAGDPKRPGIVHRLDKDTSGVIVLAQTHHALNHLQSQFKRRTIYKRYLALVEGVPSSPAGVIEASIGRDPGQRKRMAVTHDGREAITRYSTLETFEHHCLIAVEMQTGRTHQIRVHMAWLGHPVVGDRVYGFRKQRISLRRFFLHASDLHIDSPSRGERLRFAAPLPPELDTVLQALRQGTF